jgi:hypothetical protein
MIRIFLRGTLCGVIITAAFAYLFAIPANNYYWKTEISKRHGAAWTTDKNGHSTWKWTVDPISDDPPEKPVVAPSSATKVRTEKL